MTSLIFGSIYMGHQAIVHHRRDKQRTKNYQRWEDLREEYDEQKKITRQSQSLDFQRTGSESYFGDHDGQKPILTLRDQQEANDARMSWRPQESWEHPHRPQASVQQPDQNTAHRATSTPSVYWSQRGQIKPQKTGLSWDEGLPPALQVSRRSYDENAHNPYKTPARSQTVQVDSTLQRNASVSSGREPSPRSSQYLTHVASAPPVASYQVPYVAKTPDFHVEPLASHVPGGRMAELIERGY